MYEVLFHVPRQPLGLSVLHDCVPLDCLTLSCSHRIFSSLSITIHVFPAWHWCPRSFLLLSLCTGKAWLPVFACLPLHLILRAVVTLCPPLPYRSKKSSWFLGLFSLLLVLGLGGDLQTPYLRNQKLEVPPKNQWYLFLIIWFGELLCPFLYLDSLPTFILFTFSVMKYIWEFL